MTMPRGGTCVNMEVTLPRPQDLDTPTHTLECFRREAGTGALFATLLVHHVCIYVPTHVVMYFYHTNPT